MDKNSLKASLISFVIFVVIGFLSFPWILYGIGLVNIKGRPVHASKTPLTKTEAEALWQQLQEIGPIRIEKLGPWDYVFFLAGNGKVHSGEYLAWYVAKNYNEENLKDKRMAFWHLSGASLTIWLTRNWTVEQLLAKANEIKLFKERI